MPTIFRSRPAGHVLLVLGVTIVATTCDASNLFGPTGADEVSLAYLGDSVLVAGRLSTPVVQVRNRGREVAAPRLRLSTSDSTILVLAPAGELLGKQRGGATLVIAVESSILPGASPSLTVPIRVVAESLTVDRRGDLHFGAIGDTATLVAWVWDATGSLLVGMPPQWVTTAPTVVTVSAQGLVEAKGNGSADVRVIADFDTVIVPVIVEQQLVRYRFAPTTLLLQSLGATATVVATGEDSRGNPIPPSTDTAPIWLSRAPGIVTVQGGGIATARQNGVTYLVAQRDPIIDSVRVEVHQRAKQVVITSPEGYHIRSIGGEVQLTALGLDSLNQPVGNDLPSWTSLTPTVALVEPHTGLVVATGEGEAMIVAAMDAVADTATVTVTNAPATVEIRPSDATLTSVGDTLQLTASVRNERNILISGAQLRWHTPQPVLMDLSAEGRAIALAVGTAHVIATSGEVADTATITITNAPASIDLLAAHDSLIYLGAMLVPEVAIRNARGVLLDRASVSWSSDDIGIARVSATGVVTAAAVGTTVIRASYGTITDSLRLQVTNDPGSVVIGSSLDTLTALGQVLQFTAEVRNKAGAALDYPVEWRSTLPAVAGVSTGGTVTATGFGTALIIGKAGLAADTVVLVVVNPTRLYVDNAVVAVERFGTLKRPYARLQDGVAAADANDTVIVRRGLGYSETVALSRRITLLGDSTAFIAGNRDPLLLPRLAHDSGSAGIVARTTAPVTIRYLAITHSLDGAAIDSDGADIRIDQLYVNPVDEGIKIGRGILVRNAPSFAQISNVEIRNVRGYGVRLDGVSQGLLQNVVVLGVDSIPGTTGSGIVIRKGSQCTVSASSVRYTQGPQILLDSTAAAAVIDSDLAGRTQLIRVRGATAGTTRIERNTFDLRLQSGATDSRGSANDGRSGVEIRGAADVHLRENEFLEPASAMMDAVRLIDARGVGQFGGATLAQNRFRGGRHHVRSERSSWTLSGSRSDSAVVPVVATATDSLRLEHDTLGAVTGAACVQSTGANAQVVIVGGVFNDCSVDAAAVGGRALHITGIGVVATVSGATFVGANHVAVDFNGRDFTARGTRISGTGTRTAAALPSSHAMQLVSAQTVTLVGNTITDHPDLTGIYVDSRTVRIDSNLVARNQHGIRLADWQSAQLVDNDIADQAVAGAANGLSRGLSMPGNWWGDARGPRRDANIAATGDSAVGPIGFNAVRATPMYAGATATGLRHVRGSGQSQPAGTTLARAFTARVVDANGRPVAGVGVTFTVTEGGGRLDTCVTTECTVSATSDPSGLAEATLTLGALPGPNTVTATAGGLPPLTFTATGTPP